MTDKQKIRAEIERQREWMPSGFDESRMNDHVAKGTNDAVCDSLLRFIDRLPESTPYTEKAAQEYSFIEAKNGHVDYDSSKYEGFIAGANWKQEIIEYKVYTWLKATNHPYVSDELINSFMEYIKSE